MHKSTSDSGAFLGEKKRRDNLIYALFVARVEVEDRVEGCAHTVSVYGITLITVYFSKQNELSIV